MITTNARTKDLEDVGLLFHSILRYAEAVDKALLGECRLFDNEPALLEAVCRKTGCELGEVAGSTFYITLRNGEPTLIDDRGFAHAIDGPVEDFIAGFEL